MTVFRISVPAACERGAVSAIPAEILSPQSFAARSHILWHQLLGQALIFAESTSQVRDFRFVFSQTLLCDSLKSDHLFTRVLKRRLLRGRTQRASLQMHTFRLSCFSCCPRVGTATFYSLLFDR